MLDVEARVTELGLKIPPPRERSASKPYDLYVIEGSMLYLSGHIPDIEGEPPLRGIVGTDLDLTQAQDASRRSVRNILATMRRAVGDLNGVARIVKVLGLVQAAPHFTDHPAVINAASQIFVDLWGEDAGRSARSAVGVASLPLGVPVEIELLASLKP